MPRKPEPSFELKKIIWDLAASAGKINYESIQRQIDQTLATEDLNEDTPSVRTIKRIIDNDINDLSPEAALSKLPKHVWKLREDCDAIERLDEEATMINLQLSGLTPQEIATKLGRKIETVKRHLGAKSVEKTGQQGEIAQAMSRELISEIRKLAKQLDQLTHVPEPHRAFLRDDVQFAPKDKEEIIKGDTSPILTTIMKSCIFYKNA